MPIKTEPDLSDFLTTKEVAERFLVTQNDVQKAIKRGLISAQKVGYFYLIYGPNLPHDWPTSASHSDG